MGHARCPMAPSRCDGNLGVALGPGSRKLLGLFKDGPTGPFCGVSWHDGLPVAGQDVLEEGSFAIGSLMMGWVGVTALAGQSG